MVVGMRNRRWRQSTIIEQTGIADPQFDEVNPLMLVELEDLPSGMVLDSASKLPKPNIISFSNHLSNCEDRHFGLHVFKCNIEGLAIDSSLVNASTFIV